MPAARRAVLVSAASGVVWAVIAWLLGERAMGRLIWGGVLAAPLIGIAGGLASRYFPASGLRRSLFSLVSLYLSATLFGLAIGALDLFTGPSRNALEVLLQGIPATLWGLTFTGAVLVLWPLAHLNHAIIAQLWDEAG